MRLIELRLKNLNSLKGEWHINFADRAFVDEGIFAITGQTGAGKTTILDAICLALYARTPRIEGVSKSNNEVMTRQTAECFAEVVIDLNGARYRCRWGQRRAYNKADGNLQDATHEIAKLKHDDSSAEGVLLESGIKPTKNKIIELTGMDFQQFTRSILLAQGSFSAFLKAEVDERADILEKITGTDIYATISKQVHGKKRLEEEKLNALQYKIDGLQLLDADKERQLSIDLQDYQHRQQDMQQTLKTLSEQLAWLDAVSGLEDKLQSAQYDLQQAKQADIDFVPQAKRLNAATKALEIESQFSQLTHIREQLEQLTTEKNQLEQDLPTQEIRVQEASETLKAEQDKQQAADAALKDALPKIATARKLDNDIAQQRRTVQDINGRLDALNTDIASLRQDLSAQQHTAAEKQQQLTQLTEKLTNAEALTHLESDIFKFDNECKDLKKVLQHNITLSADKAQQVQKRQEQQTALEIQQQRQQTESTKTEQAQAQLAKLQQAQNALIKARSVSQMRETQEQIDHLSQQMEQLRFHNQQRQDLEAQIKQVKDDIGHIHKALCTTQERLNQDEKTLKATQEKREDKHNQLQLQQKVAALEHYIADLQDGHPCPLCGALEHPYNKSHPHLVSDGDSSELAQYILALDKEIATLNQNITAQHIEQASKKTTLESKQHQQAELTTHSQTHDKAITDTMRAISQYIKEDISSDSAIMRLLQPLVTLNDNDDHAVAFAKKLTECKDKLTQHKAHLKDTLARYDDLSTRIIEARQDSEAARHSQFALASAITAHQTQIAIIDTAITTLDNQLATNFNELEALMTAILQRLAMYATNNYHPPALEILQRAPHDLQSLAEHIEQQTVLDDAECDSQLDHLRQQRRALVQLKDTFNKEQKAQQSLQSELERLHTHIENKDAQLTKDAAALAALKHSITDNTESLSALEKQRTQAFSATDIDTAERQMRDAVACAQDSSNAAQRRLDSERYNLQQLTAQAHTLKQRIEDATQTKEAAYHTFNEALARSDFSDEAAFMTARLPIDERNQLKSEQTHIDYTLKQAQRLFDDLTRTLAQQRAQPLTDDDRETLTRRQTQTETDFNQCMAQIGAIKQQLHDNDSKKESQQTQLVEIDKQKAALAIWEQLYKLIGSADGKKYRTFAQGLTFDIMIGHANKQLHKMSSRYLLTRDDDKPLELNVIDNHQGGEIRSTKNLSGGEGFIISLALALGLSQMASQNIRVDSLFLDEGFGTLDEESLDIALDTLTNLQQEGKLIGVISHIQALKDRILTQIKVEKRSGGFSHLHGAGCAQVAGK